MIIIAMLKRAWDAIASPHFDTSTLDGYIHSKGPTSVQDVEFWTREFDNRQRMINTAMTKGHVVSANWIRQNY